MARRKTKTNKNNSVYLAVVFGLILIVAVGAIALQNGDSQKGDSFPLEISVEQAYTMREEGAYILDVRTGPEWVEGHIPDAGWIPLDELPERLAEVPTDSDVVVICRSGNRSAAARDILLGAGFENVTSVRGGMNEWAANGYPIVTGP